MLAATTGPSINQLHFGSIDLCIKSSIQIALIVIYSNISNCHLHSIIAKGARNRIK